MAKINKKDVDKSLHLDQLGKDTLLALLTSKTKTEAANKLSISRQQLYNREKKYGLVKFLEEIPQKALQTLQMGSVRAAEMLVEQLDSDKNAMEAAKEILDRVGIVKREGPTIATQFNLSGEKDSFKIITTNSKEEFLNHINGETKNRNKPN